jgi:hypothetical protein
MSFLLALADDREGFSRVIFRASLLQPSVGAGRRLRCGPGSRAQEGRPWLWSYSGIRPRRREKFGEEPLIKGRLAPPLFELDQSG